MQAETAGVLHRPPTFAELPRPGQPPPVLDSGSSDEETEANKFAADLLVSPAYRSELIKLNSWNSRQVRAFADRLGVAPAIVACRLQFELKDYRFGKDLFEKYELVD
ncbi:hypothetical protein LZG04_11870 [Saccharothrix sp. S26]|uniref:ImmA/IrrE family metallo-endopeptidase n=1 Tax=Saccharothrix sp. S26 TaxID=2907215 RepID=UPI001F433E21|nr:hypothetical protein [Saccharothrix sp. S26]MCE6995495.1 hypothetical protein [Saccharothrix sp. S26]